MYLEKDFFLNINKPVIDDDKDAYQFIKKVFPEMDIEPNQGSYRTALLCLLIYIGYCASPVELSAMFGPYFSSAPVRTRLAEMYSGKHGILAALNWANNDMCARRAYHITKQGYVSYLSTILDAIKPIRGEIKIRRSGGLVPVHDYGVGLSLYSFLLAGRPFYYEKEETYSFRSVIKQKGSICVDCTIYLRGTDRFRIYLEQDTGTETTTTLINKIATYKHLGLADNASCILFSSHSVMPFSSCLSFSAAAVETIIDGMESCGAEGLYAYYSDYGNALDKKSLEIVKKLLVRTGICSALSEKGTALMPESVTASSHLVRTRIYTYAYKVECGSRLCEDFTLNDLKRYLAELKAGCNPYRLRLYNANQYRIAKAKYRNMCTVLSNYVARGKYTREDVLCLLGGYACYMLPSVLIANAASLWDPFDNSFMDNCRKAVAAYYPGIDKLACAELSETFYFDEYTFVTFRNACVEESGRTVCFEHIGKDVGAFLRCYYISLIAKKIPDLNLHIVAVCDNDADMLFFCELTGYCMKYARFPEKKGFFLSFLTEEELSDDFCLLKGVFHQDTLVPVHIRTKAQVDELVSFTKSVRPAAELPENMSISQLFSL